MDAKTLYDAVSTAGIALNVASDAARDAIGESVSMTLNGWTVYATTGACGFMAAPRESGTVYVLSGGPHAGVYATPGDIPTGARAARALAHKVAANLRALDTLSQAQMVYDAAREREEAATFAHVLTPDNVVHRFWDMSGAELYAARNGGIAFPPTITHI